MISHAIRPAADIQWVVEEDGIILFPAGSGPSARLRGAEAAFWGILSRCGDYPRILEKMAVVAGWTPDATRAWIEAIVEVWQEKGYLARQRGTNG